MQARRAKRGLAPQPADHGHSDARRLPAVGSLAARSPATDGAAAPRRAGSPAIAQHRNPVRRSAPRCAGNAG
jgi:hypothetical protein